MKLLAWQLQFCHFDLPAPSSSKKDAWHTWIKETCPPHCTTVEEPRNQVSDRENSYIDAINSLDTCQSLWHILSRGSEILFFLWYDLSWTPFWVALLYRTARTPLRYIVVISNKTINIRSRVHINCIQAAVCKHLQNCLSSWSRVSNGKKLVHFISQGW